MHNDTQNIIGVDVGSGSVRAGVFNLRGELLAHATREITLFRSAGNKVEQSSREIWQAVCYCIKTAVANAGVSPSSLYLYSLVSKFSRYMIQVISSTSYAPFGIHSGMNGRL